jgi:phosphorylcholine metabolism protein LicD
MINNAEIQAAWISKVKSSANITSLVSSGEIREDFWKGTDFVYPSIRLKLNALTPTANNPACNTFKQMVSIQVYIEQKSSRTGDEIAGVIATEFIGKTFTVNGIKVYSITLESLVPADVPENDPNSWLAVVNLNTLVSPA